MFNKHAKRLAFTFILVLAGAMILAGCGDKKKALSENELAGILPDDITSYQLDGEIHSQEVKELEIIKRNTGDDNDFVECRIELQDKDLARTVFADLYLTYYEKGGWLIDSWNPYDEEKAQPFSTPEPESIKKLVENEFEGITENASDDSQLSNGYCTRSFDIHEDHPYASFTGEVICNSQLKGNMASLGSMAEYYWNNELERNVKVIWNIDGEWLLTENEADLPDKVYAGIFNFDQNNSADIIAYYAFPAHDGNNYMGFYGDYLMNSSNISTYGVCAADATLEVVMNFYNSVALIFTPDAVTADVNHLEGHDFSIIRADSRETYDKWNDFPKGSEYDFPTF